MNNIYYVYLHRKATNNQVFYVGKGKKRRAYNTSARNAHWKNIANKHGVIVEIYKKNLSEEKAYQLEIELIKNYGQENLCNYTAGGGGPLGKPHTEEYKEHMRKLFTGRRFTPETIEKMRKAAIKRCANPEYREKRAKSLRGRKHTESHKKKIAEAGMGRVLTLESRQKISNYHKGKKKKPEAVRKMALSKMKPVFCITNNTLYESISEASRNLKISHSKISDCAHGRIKKVKGYEFVFDDPTTRLPTTQQ